RRPERILQLAVQRMMPKNKIGRHMLAKMKLYAGTQHPHQAQQPIPLEALSGRPTPAGAVFAPKPTVEPRVKSKKKSLSQPAEAAATAATTMETDAPPATPPIDAASQLPTETPPPAPAPSPSASV